MSNPLFPFVWQNLKKYILIASPIKHDASCPWSAKPGARGAWAGALPQPYQQMLVHEGDMTLVWKVFTVHQSK